MHLSRLFQRSVHMYADRPALAIGRGAPLSYAQLSARVERIAVHLLEDLGLQPGDRVCLAMQNTAEYAEAKLAIWRARLCAVPVNSKLHPAEVGHILQDCGAGACLATGPFLESLRGWAQQQSCLPDVRWVDVRDALWQQVRTDGSPSSAGAGLAGIAAPDGSELAWLFYTSGTTGRPKGVMLTHDNLVAMALSFQANMLAIGCDDVLLHAAPMSHGGGLYAIPYWAHGGLQVVPDSGGFEEQELLELLTHYRSASLFASPTMVMRMVRFMRARPDTALAGLRNFLVGGAPFYPQDIQEAVQCFGPRIAQLYGQGESPMTITSLRAEQLGRAVMAQDLELLASVGFPQTAIDIDILDPEGRRQPAGQLGEVVVRGPTVMKGYWSNPEATERTLQATGLWTGDIGLLDARGLLHLKDRSKDVIISGGTNIYPREVEDALLSHPCVREVSVVGMPDQDWGESVAAFVVADPAVSQEELNEHCLQAIARFKRPKRYVFLAALPKNPTGKVLKSELRRLL